MMNDYCGVQPSGGGGDPFIPWSDYRADFEREASRVLGRSVKGDVHVRRLPFP